MSARHRVTVRTALLLLAGVVMLPFLVMVAFIVSVLRPAGYEVATASNVAEALATARGRTPDLIISDMQMPGADGYELLDRVKADPDLRQVPFIFTSASLWDRAEQRRGVEQGADLFLQLPGEPQAILSEVDRLLSASGKSDGQPLRRLKFPKK